MASIHKKKLRSGKTIWELTHGKPPNRLRIKAGDTRQEAEVTLSLFKRQLAAQGSAPVEITLERAVASYEEYLSVNRRRNTARRYVRVLKTFTTFFRNFRPATQLLRDVRTAHIEDYKRRRLAGEIIETKTDEE